MSNHPAYAYLGSQRWVRREHVPDSILAEYDRTFAVAERNPSAIDPKTGRSFGAQWLDTVDKIADQVAPLLDRFALLQDQDLRSRAERRALDAMLSPRTRP